MPRWCARRESQRCKSLAAARSRKRRQRPTQSRATAPVEAAWRTDPIPVFNGLESEKPKLIPEVHPAAHLLGNVDHEVGCDGRSHEVLEPSRLVQLEGLPLLRQAKANALRPQLDVAVPLQLHMQKVIAAGEPAASRDAARTTLRRCRPILEALVLLWVCCIGQADGGLHGDRTAADSLAAEASTGVPLALPSALARLLSQSPCSVDGGNHAALRRPESGA